MGFVFGFNRDNLMQRYQSFFLSQRNVRIESVEVGYPFNRVVKRAHSYTDVHGRDIEIVYDSRDHLLIDTILVFQHDTFSKCCHRISYKYASLSRPYEYVLAEQCITDDIKSTEVVFLYTDNGDRVKSEKPLGIIMLDYDILNEKERLKRRGRWNEPPKAESELERAKARLKYKREKFSITFVKHTTHKSKRSEQQDEGYYDTLKHIDITEYDYISKDNTGTPAQSFMSDIVDVYNEYVKNYDYE